MVHELFDITGRKAVVTGGTRGLGFGMAEGLLEAGCEVCIVGSREPNVQKAMARFKARGFSCSGVFGDLSKREEVYRVFNEALEKLGGDLDILVAAHGIQRRHSAEMFPLSDWDDVINVNAIAPGYMATEMNTMLMEEHNPERYRQITERIPAGRWGTGEDMKGACIFLSSHASDYLGGAVIPVDGGYLVK